ncbi:MULTISPECIES: hypothetical protein [unclassified Pseudomonas]|uniref:hypothetical protein n=1 Tax=unclassified Pseudomonas TaxID=196821 RepID=UPI00244A6219|nr:MULTISPECIES: hypothetical protein [unclassified Pseudomonas]MDG9930060.1 hypothetical protein [Pseudomonas sp. GD04042]MDH0483538.1 hypothetical protein [Pseudomonas sp. GD04015]MDH0605534.1 hypothetical protein [Pseudomonas sp. GD03869]
MSRRRTLKGVAAGVSSSFASRNNDIEGYWGLGIIYREIDTAGRSSVHLDILSGESCPPIRHAERLAETYRSFLFARVKSLGLQEHHISNAAIELAFNIPSTGKDLARQSRGEAFRCQVSITDDLGKTWVHSHEGRCRRHNPRMEQRSGRYVL